jgi:hypothetical protein
MHECLLSYDIQPESSSSRSLQSDVVTTEVLEHYGVSFNTLYKLLICTSCGEGFPLRSLYTHLAKDGANRQNWDSALRCWKKTAVVYENHTSGRLETRNKFKVKIIKSLISAGYIAEEGEIRDADSSTSWKDLPLPGFTGTLRPQVAGLRTFHQATQCAVPDSSGGLICGYISTSMKSFRNHLSKYHGRGHITERQEVVAQTLNEDWGWQEYFEVSPEAPSTFDQTINPNDPIDASGFNLEAAHGLLHQTTATYMDELDVVPDLDIRTILPVFVETGIDQFIQQFNRKNFRKFFDPDPDDLLYATLRLLIIETYKEGITLLQLSKVPSNILLFMTNCTP